MKKIILVCIALLPIVCFSQVGDSLNKYDSNGLKTGKWIINYMGTKKVAIIEHYYNGEKNGLFSRYGENGILEEESEYLNDTLNGISKSYYRTGEIEIHEIKSGKLEGFTRLYNYKNQLVQEWEYHNNMLNGVHRIFYESGRTWVEANFINGRETGTRRTFEDNDKKEVISEADFINDERIEIRYFKKGKLIKTTREKED